jgi:hypothetical protein
MKKHPLTSDEYLELGRLLRERRNDALEVQNTVGRALPLKSKAFRAAERVVEAIDTLRSALENEAARDFGDDVALRVYSDCSRELDEKIQAAAVHVALRLARWGSALESEVARQIPRWAAPVLGAVLSRLVVAGKATRTSDGCYRLTPDEGARVRRAFPVGEPIGGAA